MATVLCILNRTVPRRVAKEFDFESENTLKEAEVSGDWGYFWST